MKQIVFPALLIALLCPACSDDSSDCEGAECEPNTDSDLADIGVDVPSDAAADLSEDVAIDAPAEPELDFTPDPTCTEGDWVVRLSGTVELSDGTTDAGVKAQVCLRRAASDVVLCLRPVDTAADGTFSVTMPPNERCVEQLSLRVLKTASTFATTYCHIETSEQGADLVVADPFVIFDTSAPADLPAVGDVDTAREVDFGGGVTLNVIPSQLESEVDAAEAYEVLRAVVLDPATTSSCFIDPADGFDAYVGFDPEVNVRGDSYDAILPNPAGHPAGARVDIFVQGGLFVKLEDGQLVPEADWVRSGFGTVSDDGASIEAPGAVAGLNWLAWRLAE